MKEVKNKNIGNTGILIILSIFLALSGMAAMASADGIPTPPNQFYGTIDGADAGTIDAYIGDVLKGSIEFTEGKFGYDLTYLDYLDYLDVEGTNDDAIDFKIGADVVGSTTWAAGTGPRELQLSTGGDGGDDDDGDDGDDDMPPSPPGDDSPGDGGDDGDGSGDDDGDDGDDNQNAGSPSSGGPGSSPGTLPADGSATTAPGDGDGMTPESTDAGTDAPDGADGGAKPATGGEDEPGSTGFLTGSGATALAVVGLLVILALIAFVIKRRT